MHHLAKSLVCLLLQILICVGPLGSVARAARILKIGILEEPKTLNVWLASDSWSKKVLSQIYQPLYIREPKTLRLIPWLAAQEPVFDEASLSYTIRLRPGTWSDGSEFTSEDVTFTGNLIKSFKVPQYYSNWKFIKKIEPVNRHAVRFHLEEPQAIFLTRTLTTPIVQKREWAGRADTAMLTKKPLTQLFSETVDRPVGMGPFVLKEWKQGAYLFLEKNKHFFGQVKEIGGYLLGPHIDGIIFKMFGTTDAAILAIKRGTIDMFWWGIQPGYMEDLFLDRNIQILSNEKSALYYLGFNLRRSPFNDIHFRHAVATLIDKDFIVKRILQGYAMKMQSVVPPGNTFWHCPDLSEYGSGLSREDRIRRAYEILKKGNYGWKVPPVNAEGKVVEGEGIILPGGDPMQRITILTPPADYDPLRAMVGIMVQEWLKMVGIPATSRPMGFGSLVHHVKGRHECDLFVMGYGQLSLDPDYLRNFFHSSQDRSRGWNMSGYQDTHYDRISDASARTMDMEKRRDLIWEMQRILARDIPYLPLYNPKLIEAVRNDKFEGWVGMVGGIGNIWSFCTIKPKDME